MRAAQRLAVSAVADGSLSSSSPASGQPAAVSAPTSAGVPQAIASCTESGNPSPTLGSTSRSAAW